MGLSGRRHAAAALPQEETHFTEGWVGLRAQLDW